MSSTMSMMGAPTGYVSAPLAAGPMARLVLVLECQRPLAPSEHFDLLDVRTVRIGRGGTRELRPCRHDGALVDRLYRWHVPDPAMSVLDAILTPERKGWTLEDAAAAGNVRLNGAVIRRARLRDGDVIEIGSTFFVFRCGANCVGAVATEAALPALRTLEAGFARRLSALRRVARSLLPVLIQGAVGTGKELTARAVHAISGRSGPFVAINCGALPEPLIESELFGTRRGAFSGAQERQGLVRAAEGGTLFLDEIAELSESSQVALLRVLQEREVLAVGDTQPVPVDVRFVAATHQDLEARIREGAFREDLYSRLAGFEISLPTLCSRREDIGSLFRASLDGEAAAAPVRLEPAAARALLLYDWPRNGRELDNALRAATVLAADNSLRLERLPERVQESANRPPLCDGGRRAWPTAREPEALQEVMVAQLRKHRGNITAIARELGKHRAQIHRWLARLDLDPELYRAEEQE